jgi:hypothetical protein
LVLLNETLGWELEVGQHSKLALKLLEEGEHLPIRRGVGDAEPLEHGLADELLRSLPSGAPPLQSLQRLLRKHGGDSAARPSPAGPKASKRSPAREGAESFQYVFQLDRS